MKTITKELKKYICSHCDGYGDWHSLKYDARKKMFRGVDKEDFKEAQDKHFHRNYVRTTSGDYTVSELRKAYNSVKKWSKPENGSYQKVAMYGNNWLYLCSPVYGHADYNKSRILRMKGHETQCEWLIRVSEKTSQIK